MGYRTRSLIPNDTGRVQIRNGQNKDFIRLSNEYFLPKKTLPQPRRFHLDQKVRIRTIRIKHLSD